MKNDTPKYIDHAYINKPKYAYKNERIHYRRNPQTGTLVKQ